MGAHIYAQCTRSNKTQITDQSRSTFELEAMAAQEVVDGPVGALLGEAKVSQPV